MATKASKNVLEELPALADGTRDVTGPQTYLSDVIIPDAGLKTATNNTGEILINDGTNYNPVAMSGDVTIDAAGVATVVAGGSDQVVEQARVNEAAGVTVGDVVFITGATGGVPQISLADNSDFTKVDVLAMCNEAGADNDLIEIVLLGLVEDVDTSAASEGDVLYLTTLGQFTHIHPTGIDAVVRIGYVVKDNPSTGSILFTVDSLTHAAVFDGVVRSQIVNCSAGTSAVTSFTLVNDPGHRGSVSLSGSNFAAGAEEMSWYNQGYGPTNFFNDGNVPFLWFTDVTDQHDASNLSIVMTLDPNGDLTVEGQICVGPESTAAGTLARQGNTGLLRLSGGDGGANGSNVSFHGPSHASRARDIEFREGTNPILDYDHSDVEWTFATDVVMDKLLDLSAATAGQIEFPATQNASANANTLDDYEEGTWTPALTGTSGSGITYTTQVGTYTKIGNTIFLQGRLTINSMGTAAGIASITGLPFTSSSTTNNFGGLTFAFGKSLALVDTTGVSISGLIGTNGTTCSFQKWSSSAGSVDTTIAHLSAGADLIFQGQYTV